MLGTDANAHGAHVGSGDGFKREDTAMTILEVKELLPDVQVRLESGKIVTAQVRGRKLPFAKVQLPDGRSYEWAWETITDCLTNNRPLQV